MLSHENGKFPATEDTQKLLCFLDNGELLIMHRKRMDPLVQEYELFLRRAGRQFLVVETELDELKALYRRTVVEASEVRTDKDDSARQRQIIAMIRDAASHNASDIHAYEGRNLGEIRFRINGRLETLPGYQMEPEEVNAIIATIYNSMIENGGNATYFQPGAPQDGRIRQEFLDEDTLSGVRCATRPKDRGMIGIFRLLYAHKGVKSLPSLGYLPEQVNVWTRLLRRRVGMNILSGPTGSGKSTTLSTIFAMQVDYFQRQMHILTAEDPVEYEIPGVNHTNVDRDSSNNPAWARSIKNMMRLDPDIAGVGEMRDHDSAVAAFALATTGHGTYSTLHANDGFAIIQRLLDLNVDPGLIYDPAVLTGMINQGLAPTICPNCRVPWSERPDTYDQELAERVEATIEDTSGIHVGAGCEKCRFTGAGGRTVVAEVIETNLDLMRTLRTAGAAEARALWVRKYSGITKSMHIIQRVREGLIDPAHAEAVIGMPIDEDRRTIVVA
ncbi:Flp pilus assembly complex ATPase component TadA [Xanthomonas campestris pv. campestris]|uniref:GspE/PulE family protein n=1 Tax=Xanthomonas campestris TaxID=339 RepID=UPI001E51506A|nr:ATPase, T2SS/T4P/T4SS family [Xanthomonas campestris]MCD0253115.1 Flp pilus assembly complex ATPase component TadA [Xanthomonas campestris pv. campestris]